MLPLRRLLCIALLSAGTAVALGWARPAPSGSPLGWSGTETATVGAWALAVAAATWLAVVSVVCLVAVRRGHTALAHAAARRAPRIVRRAVEGALAASLLVGTAVGTAAGAATVDVPVVRTPHAASIPSPTTVAPVRDTPSTTAPQPTSTTTSHAPVPADAPPPVEQPVVRGPVSVAPQPSHAATAPAPTRPAARPSATHVVVAGDNLWRIARAELIARGDPQPDDAAIAGYWRRVIDANRSTLRSGNPSLIYPGEIVALPEPV
jgi:nucleoid-associated protein YgaU